jgi:hypothetical protein
MAENTEQRSGLVSDCHFSQGTQVWCKRRRVAVTTCAEEERFRKLNAWMTEHSQYLVVLATSARLQHSHLPYSNRLCRKLMLILGGRDRQDEGQRTSVWQDACTVNKDDIAGYRRPTV